MKLPSRKFVSKLAAAYDHAVHQVRDESARLQDGVKKLARVQRAQQIIQDVAQHVQQQAHDQVAGIVTRCLQNVFIKPYEFKIHFVKSRGKTEAILSFLEDGHEIDPLDGSGGGLLDVAAFALRISAIILTRPHRRRFLILDEPFRFVGERNMNRDRVRILLETLSTELSVQILMATHDEELVAGEVIEIKKQERPASKQRAGRKQTSSASGKPVSKVRVARSGRNS